MYANCMLLPNQQAKPNKYNVISATLSMIGAEIN